MPHRSDRLLLHTAFDHATLFVELVEARGECRGFGGRISDQATDADRHVIEAPGGIQPWSGGETEVSGDQPGERTTPDLEQRTQTRGAATGTDALQALRDQHPVVMVERYDIGDGAERHQVQPGRGRWQGWITQRTVQRGHHVERDAHTGETA